MAGAQVNLQPLAKTQEGLLSYLDLNFRRLGDAIEGFANIEQGILTVTGSVEIDTGIEEVYNCYATLNGAPVSGACFVRCYPVGSSAPSNIIIEVYTSSFAASTTAKSIAWLAIGK